MRKGFLKAASLFMALCLTIGSAPAGQAESEVTITPVNMEETIERGLPELSFKDMLRLPFHKFSEFVGGDVIRAEAAEEKWKYVLDLAGTELSDGSTATMEKENVYVSLSRVNSKGDKDMSVVDHVVFFSDQPDIVSCSQKTGDFGATLTANSPGWALIKVTIYEVDGTVSELSFAVLVRAELDRTDPQWKNLGAPERVLVLDPKQLSEYQLKFKDLDPSKNSSAVRFKDPVVQGVVSVDSNGLLKIEGSGYTEITIENYANVTIEGKEEDVVVETKTIEVIVLPVGSDVNDENQFDHTVDVRVKDDEFILYTNATPAARLEWEVYTVDQNGRKKALISPDDTSLLSYTYDGKAVRFSGVKAGTYIVEAYATKKYPASERDLPCLTYNVVVELSLNNSNTKYMNVGDLYNIIADSNIPEGMFGKLFTVTANPATESVATINRTTGVVTAILYGQQKFTIYYQPAPGYGIYTAEEAAKLKPFEYTFEVIDTISLNNSSLSMYVGGTYQLKPNQTRPGGIYWEISENDAQYISVNESGLVTALKETPKNYEATVIAYQMIDGVKKMAVCKITVQPSVSNIELSPSEVMIGIGEVKSIEALITPPGLVDVNLTWSSSDPSIFDVASVNGPTSVQIIGKSGGTAILTAINDKNIVVGYCTVTVKQLAQKLTLSETDLKLALYQKTYQLFATFSPADTTNQEIIWSSTDNSVATVDENGKITLKKSGKTTIMAQSKENPSIMAFCQVEVLRSVNGVELDLDSLEMYVGESRRLTYTVYPTNATNLEVEWTSFDTSIVNVDDTGMLTARGTGTTQIMVMSLDGSYYDICTVIVKQKATGVKMNVTELTMNTGEYFDMKVTITPATSTEASLTWESLNTKVVTVSSTGRITARAAGTAIILVKTENGATSYCTVTVMEAVRSMELDPSDLVIEVGESFMITPVFTPASASNTAVRWTSSDSSVAEINAAGEVTGLAKGSAVITCESMDGGYRAFCLVTVKEPILDMKISPETYRLGLGKTFVLSAVSVKDGVETEIEAEWYSSDDSICTVDKFGKIKGMDYGYATITAEATDGSGRYAVCEVRVVREVTSIKLNHSVLTMVQGEDVALVATVLPSNATYRDVTFSTDDENVAMVDEDGVITALMPGTTKIYARAKDNSGKFAVCHVTVIAPIASTGVAVSDTEIVLMPGETKQVNVSIRPNNSTDSKIWSSGNEAIATVSGDGMIKAVSTGTTTVTVMTSSGRTAVVNVIVLGLSRTSIEIPVYSQYTRLVVDGATANVRWDVENTSICEVRGGVITARKVGTTYVLATVNGRTLKCKVKVVR